MTFAGPQFTTESAEAIRESIIEEVTAEALSGLGQGLAKHGLLAIEPRGLTKARREGEEIGDAQRDEFILVNAGDELATDAMPGVVGGLNDSHWHITTAQGYAERESGQSAACYSDETHGLSAAK